MISFITYKVIVPYIIVICKFLISCMMAIFDEWMVIFGSLNKITVLILEKLKSCCCREVKNESENKFLDKVGYCNHILSLSKVSWARVTTQEEKRLIKQLRKNPNCVERSWPCLVLVSKTLHHGQSQSENMIILKKTKTRTTTACL